MRANIRKKATAVYRQYDADGNLLYVGIALSVQKRTLMHKSCSPWLNSVTRIDIEWYPDRSSAMDAESLAISLECPKHNTLKMTSRLKKMLCPSSEATRPKPILIKPEDTLITRKTHAQRRAADRLGLVSVARGYATKEQAARILRERAEIEAAIATEVARMQGERDE